jgi:V8-like Glu-specific endopeptidase
MMIKSSSFGGQHKGFGPAAFRLGRLAIALTLVNWTIACGHFEEQKPAKSPYSAVGLVAVKQKSGTVYACTGTLIGKNILLTAAHCILNEDGSNRAEQKNVRFLPNLNGEVTNDFAIANYLWRDRLYGRTVELNRQADWALLKLDRDLGTEYGWITPTNEEISAGDVVSTIGYPQSTNNGTKPIVEDDCRVNQGVSEAPTLFFTSCKLEPGMSGGPVLLWDPISTNYKIVGINVSEGNPVNGSAHLAATTFHRALSEILSTESL